MTKRHRDIALTISYNTYKKLVAYVTLSLTGSMGYLLVRRLSLDLCSSGNSFARSLWNLWNSEKVRLTETSRSSVHSKSMTYMKSFSPCTLVNPVHRAYVRDRLQIVSVVQVLLAAIAAALRRCHGTRR